MLWLQKMEQKYGKYAIPNLTKYLIICYAIGYVIEILGSFNAGAAIVLQYMTLDVYAILHGQIWRLVTWLFIPPSSLDIFTLVMLYCYYSIGNTLERTWGTFRYNVFLIFGFIFTLLGAVLLFILTAVVGSGFMGIMGVGLSEFSTYYSMYFSTYYVSMSILLAFAITFPDAQMLFMFIIPIKMKVLGVIYVLLMAYNVFQGFQSGGLLRGMPIAVAIGFSLLNVLIFFIITRKSFRTPTQIKRQREYQKHVVKMSKVSRHKCAICGRTEESDPEEEFRFCSKCDGNYEYCSKHIYTHTHIKNS